VIPPITLAGVLLATFLHGAIVIEVVFAWPGLGRLAVESIWNNNFPVLAVVTLLFSALFIIANFLVDVSYAYIDPRIRYA
jgi:peptide/nickel transport system permease protein